MAAPRCLLDGCSKPAAAEKSDATCAACIEARYCSREHRVAHWPIHNLVCRHGLLSVTATASRSAGYMPMCFFPGCGKSATSVCGTCLNAIYCGKAHMDADWSYHQAHCIPPPDSSSGGAAAAPDAPASVSPIPMLCARRGCDQMGDQFACGLCMAVGYCSQEHMREHHEEHRLVCLMDATETETRVRRRCSHKGCRRHEQFLCGRCYAAAFCSNDHLRAEMKTHLNCKPVSPELIRALERVEEFRLAQEATNELTDPVIHAAQHELWKAARLKVARIAAASINSDSDGSGGGGGDRVREPVAARNHLHGSVFQRNWDFVAGMRDRAAAAAPGRLTLPSLWTPRTRCCPVCDRYDYAYAVKVFGKNRVAEYAGNRTDPSVRCKACSRCAAMWYCVYPPSERAANRQHQWLNWNIHRLYCLPETPGMPADLDNRLRAYLVASQSVLHEVARAVSFRLAARPLPEANGGDRSKRDPLRDMVLAAVEARKRMNVDLYVYRCPPLDQLPYDIEITAKDAELAHANLLDPEYRKRAWYWAGMYEALYNFQVPSLPRWRLDGHKGPHAPVRDAGIVGLADQGKWVGHTEDRKWMVSGLAIAQANIRRVAARPPLVFPAGDDLD